MTDFAEVARFFQEEGADRVVRAFTSLPPGPMREAMIGHMEAMAVAMGAQLQHVPAVQVRVVQPALAPPAASPPGRRLLAPKGVEGALVSTSSDGRVVERCLQGQKPHEAADAEGVTLAEAERTLMRARRQGVQFPFDTKTKPELAKGRKEDGRGMASMISAAKARGQTLDEYGRSVLRLIRLRDAGTSWAEIAAEVGMNEKQCQNYYQRRERFRANFQPVKRALREGESPVALGAAHRAAIKWGLDSADEYVELRDRARAMRQESKHPTEIAKALKVDPAFVRAVIASAQQVGTQFPLLIPDPQQAQA